MGYLYLFLAAFLWGLLGPGEALEGGEALPGFRLPLKALFGA